MLDHRQLGLGGARGERIDTARMLLVAEVIVTLRGQDWELDHLAEVMDVPQSNGVSRLARAKEMLRVWDYYPEDFIALAFRHPPAWHLLVDPIDYALPMDEVVAFMRGHMDRLGRWPSIGAVRDRFGKRSNHHPDSQQASGQETLA